MWCRVLLVSIASFWLLGAAVALAEAPSSAASWRSHGDLSHRLKQLQSDQMAQFNCIPTPNPCSSSRECCSRRCGAVPGRAGKYCLSH